MAAFLSNPGLRFILFGGKGGTGKTTSAAATALHFARLRPERKVLLVSTDPAHSLSDSLNCAVGGMVSGIPGVDNLFALALDAKALLEDFKTRYGPVIAQIADRGTYLDKEDIAGFLDLSMPGIDEVTAILKIMEVMREGLYDLVIVDTAPAGHTIRLLSLPEQMEQWIRVMDMMQEKHRYMVRSFVRRRYVPDQADKFITALSDDVQHLRDLFRNRESTEFVPVVNAEPMSIYETELLFKALDEGSIPVTSVILNRLVADSVGDDGRVCPFCQARQRNQAPYQREIERKFSQYHLVRMPLFPTEIRGLQTLAVYAEILFSETQADYVTLPALPTPHAVELAPREIGTQVGLAHLFAQDRQFILFGGKGGVGKTTLAAATAVELARRNPTGKTLIFSTDPTGSLGDSLACVIGNVPVPVTGADGLYAMQINAAERLDELKQIYIGEINELFDSVMGDIGNWIAFDREISMEFVSMIPPGMDEIVALIAMIDLIDDGSYDHFVLDTAPTGHTLRLLEMPHLAIEWFRSLFHLLLKYQGASKMAKTTQLLLDTSRGVKKLQNHLTDPVHSEFVAITIPEAMGVLETERLLTALDVMHVPCHHLVANMVVPPTACPFCRSKRAEQQGYIAELHAKWSAYTISELPLFAHDIRGLDGLRVVGKVIFSAPAE
ncbi:MAG: TRC40/GET3/ArsA family transport-energizing ATPase [Anaerolineales bacterium]|nr:TRC40/GET3/ArsA family transport-energizing ATPase [Anaerolineales bacterium]